MLRGAFVYWNPWEAQWENRGMRRAVGVKYGGERKSAESFVAGGWASSECCGPLWKSPLPWWQRTKRTNGRTEWANRTSLNGTDEWLWKQHLICIEGASLSTSCLLVRRSLIRMGMRVEVRNKRIPPHCAKCTDKISSLSVK